MKSIILDYAIERKIDVKPIYQYDFTKSLNIISIDNNKKAFIDSSHEDLRFFTQTKTINESDDEGMNILELQTKTESCRERDDNHNLFLELETKTFTDRERDD